MPAEPLDGGAPGRGPSGPEGEVIRLVRAEPGGGEGGREDAAFAWEHGLVYVAAGSAARRPGAERAGESALDRVPGGEPVIVRGAGPAFIDLLRPLTVGRGGAFRRGSGGRPAYAAGGHEPLLYVVSRRGVPYHAKIGSAPAAGPPPVGGFLRELPDGPLDHRRDVWPVVAKELTYAYYHELLVAHPERARMSWEAFAEAYAPEPWDGKAMRALIRKAVPGHGDRLNLARLDRPLAGIRFGDSAGLQRWVHGYIAAGLARRRDPAHSADLALVHGLTTVLGLLAARGEVDPSLADMAGFVAGGPRPCRLEELLALARAGVVTFAGADSRAVADPAAGLWRAGGPAVPGHVRARALIDAPSPPFPIARRSIRQVA